MDEWVGEGMGGLSGTTSFHVCSMYVNYCSLSAMQTGCHKSSTTYESLGSNICQLQLELIK